MSIVVKTLRSVSSLRRKEDEGRRTEHEKMRLGEVDAERRRMDNTVHVNVANQLRLP